MVASKVTLMHQLDWVKLGIFELRNLHFGPAHKSSKNQFNTIHVNRVRLDGPSGLLRPTKHYFFIINFTIAKIVTVMSEQLTLMNLLFYFLHNS